MSRIPASSTFGACIGHSALRVAGLLMAAACAVPLPVFGCQPDAIFADSFDGAIAPLALVERFSAPDGTGWPPPWVELANSADSVDVQSCDGRIRPAVTGYTLGRMYADVATRDVEVRFTLTLEDAASQGVGFNVRQNGGHLQRTLPYGQGYSVFVEGGFRGQPGVSLRIEENGLVYQIGHSGAAAPAPQQGVRYRVRFRVLQVADTYTSLQAKLWQADGAEPVGWQVEALDGSSGLRGVTGGIAVDSWNVATSPTIITAQTRIDDIEVELW